MSTAKLLVDVEDSGTISLFIWDGFISLYTAGAVETSVDSAMVA